MVVVLAGLLAGVLLTGLALLVLGARGTSVEPFECCAICGFDLTSLGRQTCPECGANLSEPGARRVVRRQLRTGRIWAGAGLAMLALAPPGTLVVDSLSSGRLTPQMPTWLLTTEIRLLGFNTPERVADELLARSQRGEMARATWASAARAGMAVRDGDRPLPAALNQLIADAAAAGRISKSEFAEHSIAPFLCEAEVPERVRVGQPYVTGIRNTAGAARFPADMNWIWSRRIVAVEVDGLAQPMTEAVGEAAQRQWLQAVKYSSNTVYGTGYPVAAKIENSVPAAVATDRGQHKVRITFEVGVFNGPGDAAPGTARTVREYAVEVVPRDAPLVEQVDDPALLDAVRTRLHPFVSHERPGMSCWSMSFHDEKDYSPPATAAGVRAGGAWDVFVELDGTRHPVGTYKIVFAADRPHVSLGWGGNLRIPAGTQRCTVVFVPNEAMAAARIAVDVMPRGEIVLTDVPVR